MQIHNFLRSRRLRAGLMSYEAAVVRAKSLGLTTSVQNLNKGERVSAYLTPASRELYVRTYSLSDKDAATLDCLSAQCLIMRGSNTNPWMRVIDTRAFDDNLSRACGLISDLLELKGVESELVTNSIKGILRCTIDIKTDS